MKDDLREYLRFKIPIFGIAIISYVILQNYFIQWPTDKSAWFGLGHCLCMIFNGVLFGLSWSTVERMYDNHKRIKRNQESLVIKITESVPIPFSKDIDCFISINEDNVMPGGKGSIIVFGANGEGVVDVIHCDVKQLKEMNRVSGKIRRADIKELQKMTTE